MNKERWKNYKQNLKIFFWYIATEPLRWVKDLFSLGSKTLQKRLVYFTKQSSWLFIYLLFVIIFFVNSNDKMKWPFLAILTLAILKYEWERGKYKERWREKYKKKLEKRYENHTPTTEEVVEEYQESKKEKVIEDEKDKEVKDEKDN